MKILLLGANGQLGAVLKKDLKEIGEVIPLTKNTNGLYCGDLLNIKKLLKSIEIINPDIIVNAAAYTNVDLAETEINKSLMVNGIAVKELANIASKLDILFIHYSTDYVFNGSGNKPWKESDTPDPINKYGISKLFGDEAIIKSGCKYLILRVSWVYSNNGKNFLNTIINSCKKKLELSVVYDQVGAPTSAASISNATKFAIKKILDNPSLCGLYNFSSEGYISWFEYANFIINFLNNSGYETTTKKVKAVKSNYYKSPASRPLNSRLNTSKFKNAFKYNISRWELDVENAIKVLLKKG